MARLFASLWVTLLLPSLCAPAQETAPVQAPRAPLPTGRVIGTVTCGDTHKPARGATLLVTNLPSADGNKLASGRASTPFARVASDGSYVLEHLAAGEYGIIALLPGYLSPADDELANSLGNISSQDLHKLFERFGTVTVVDHSTARFDITLQRGAAISGRVLYGDGAFASQITMEVQNVNAKPRKQSSSQDDLNAGAFVRALLLHQSLTTDDQGHYRIAGLPPGTYRVAAIDNQRDPMQDLESMGMFSLMGVAGSSHELHVYSGDTVHKKAAKTFDLRAGDEATDADITIPVQAFHRVRGTLSAADGRPINSADISLTDTTDDSLSFSVRVNREGVFVFPSVPAGTYSLTSTAARIGTIPNGYPESLPVRPEMMQATNAFADGKMSVIVNEADVSDVKLTLAEVPLPEVTPASRTTIDSHQPPSEDTP